MSNYVVVDLEMCHVHNKLKNNDFGCKSELIQIGAVLLDDALEIADTFMTFVCPEYGMIDKKIEKLTGISKMHVKNAPCAKEALEMFVAWLPNDAVLVSWSENDEKQVRNEVEGKALKINGLDKYLDNWIDCQKTFSAKMNTEKNYRLSEAISISDIALEDGAHDALVDAKNTAYLFAKMEREPVLKLNSHYISGEEVKMSTYNPFAALLADYEAAV